MKEKVKGFIDFLFVSCMLFIKDFETLLAWSQTECDRPIVSRS